ncbi:Arc family DNA-binding protein [Pseudomonas sp. 2995-3]|uniref:Arc family DNA-binding protein n=1 Tax=Pseudomonas sp. 2995-3 TaxID=1712680 RepID=UPI000C14B352
MQKSKQRPSYPLRLPIDVRGKAEGEAQENHRSLNVELGLLIEDGLKWRNMKKDQAEA